MDEIVTLGYKAHAQTPTPSVFGIPYDLPPPSPPLPPPPSDLNFEIEMGNNNNNNHNNNNSNNNNHHRSNDDDNGEEYEFEFDHPSILHGDRERAREQELINNSSNQHNNSNHHNNHNHNSPLKIQLPKVLSMSRRSEYDPHGQDSTSSLVSVGHRVTGVDVSLDTSGTGTGTGTGTNGTGKTDSNKKQKNGILRKSSSNSGGSVPALDLLNVTANSNKTLSHHRKRNSINNVTLPSGIAIPIGLAQVFVGLSMVLCGVFALRYQSYLFYYGSGLWAGTLAGVSGILGVMATKKGLNKPKWLCGGRRWQIHIFLAAVMLALSTSILAAVLSTSGLIRDTQRDLSQNLDDMTPDEEMHEKRKSSGIAINAILLLLALLQILLSFFSLGIALKVLCSRAYCGRNGSLLSSDGSEVTVRDILGDGTGPEYEARKDRLLRWLGHQRRHFFAGQNSTSAKAIMAAKNHRNNRQIIPSTFLSRGGKGVANGGTFNPRLYPQFVSGQSVMPPPGRPGSNPQYQFIQPPPTHSLPYVIPAPYSSGSDRRGGMIGGPNSLPMPYPAQIMVPVIPLPIRQPRSSTPMSLRSIGGGSVVVDGSTGTSRRRRGNGGGRSSSGSSVGGISKKSSTINRSTKKSKKSEKKPKKHMHEITDEEVGRTYTGLDRQVAEDFISNSMNSH